MDAGRKWASPAWQAAVVGAVALVTYLLTRTRDLGGDDTVYAMTVDGFLSGHGVSRELFHPHHPIYNPIVAAVCWLLRLVGFRPFVADGERRCPPLRRRPWRGDSCCSCGVPACARDLRCSPAR
jgi:hypothetical protein